MNSSHDVFALSANPELAAPDTDARGYVVLGIATLMATPRAFVDAIGDPRDGPYLSTMGVTTELEVDASCLGTLQGIRLMIEDNRIKLVEGNHHILNGLAPSVRDIVTSDDGDTAINVSHRIDEQMDTSILIELLGLRMACIELVVA